jgi:hypothetical protein
MIYTSNFNSPRSLGLYEAVYFKVTRKYLNGNRSSNNSIEFNSVFYYLVLTAQRQNRSINKYILKNVINKTQRQDIIVIIIKINDGGVFVNEDRYSSRNMYFSKGW